MLPPQRGFAALVSAGVISPRRAGIGGLHPHLKGKASPTRRRSSIGLDVHADKRICYWPSGPATPPPELGPLPLGRICRPRGQAEFARKFSQFEPYRSMYRQLEKLPNDERKDNSADNDRGCRKRHMIHRCERGENYVSQLHVEQIERIGDATDRQNKRRGKWTRLTQVAKNTRASEAMQIAVTTIGSKEPPV